MKRIRCFIVFLTVCFMIFISGCKEKSPSEVPDIDEGLPNIVETDEDNAKFSVEPQTNNEIKKEIRDPFVPPVKLLGTIITDNGKDQAIVEIDNRSLILSIGDKLEGKWQVDEIGYDYIYLKKDGENIKIDISSYANVQTGGE
ncbi:hypothetical protein [Xylanivirga thermophila]|uniref:hypothetical protein n=1 Tax=Xylanivirga thermophila TaxID=2496273 RepID=UPI00101C768C|nr:hypothetical protein [Xylanivirga thermophila]